MTRIFTDHDIILKKLELIQSGSDIQRQFYLKKFAPFLYDHVNFEEKTFYTKLDEMMSEKNKVPLPEKYLARSEFRLLSDSTNAGICKNSYSVYMQKLIIYELVGANYHDVFR